MEEYSFSQNNIIKNESEEHLVYVYLSKKEIASPLK